MFIYFCSAFTLAPLLPCLRGNSSLLPPELGGVPFVGVPLLGIVGGIYLFLFLYLLISIYAAAPITPTPNMDIIIFVEFVILCCCISHFIII